MKILLLSAIITMTAVGIEPQENKGMIEGRVTRTGLSEGIPDVQITLQGPLPVFTAASISGLYTPSPALTGPMRGQIDELIASASTSIGIPPELVANAAMRMEAQLLGLPAPATPLALPTNPTQAPQTSAISDSGGHFSFRNLAPGRYQIRAQRDGYFAALPAGTISIGAPTAATSTSTIVAGQPSPEVKLTLMRGSTVSGRIRDPNGQPISGLQVNAFQIAYQNGRKTLQSVNSKQTDDRGEYRLFWLPPGDYLIAATPRRPGPTPGPQDSFARTFYPNMTDPRTAQPMKVAEGSEIAAADINLRGEGTTRISGRVNIPFTGPNGQPLQASTFYLFPLDPSAMTDTATLNFPNSAANRTNGQFEIRGVLPGTYDLWTSAADPNTRTTSWGKARINPSGGEVQDVTINIESGIPVKARVAVDGKPPTYSMQTPQVIGTNIVVDANGSIISTNGQAPIGPVPTPSVQLRLRSMESYTTVESAANQNTSFDPSGVYSFPNVPKGRYAVQVSGVLTSSYVADIRAGGASIYDNGFDAESIGGEIEVIVHSNGVKIQGSTRDGEDKPFPSARVVLVPQQQRRQNTSLYKTAQADDKGNFTFNGVAPGEYKVFAWEAIPSTAWMNPEYLAAFEGSGKTVTAATGDASSVVVKVIPRDAGGR